MDTWLDNEGLDFFATRGRFDQCHAEHRLMRAVLIDALLRLTDETLRPEGSSTPRDNDEARVWLSNSVDDGIFSAANICDELRFSLTAIRARYLNGVSSARRLYRRSPVDRRAKPRVTKTSAERRTKQKGHRPPAIHGGMNASGPDGGRQGMSSPALP